MMRCWMIIGCLLAMQVAVFADDNRKLEVRRLVRQLDAQQLTEREAAERALVAFGPTILDALPATDDRTSAEVRERLGRVRQTLLQAASDASTRASLVTLDVKDAPLSAVLRTLQEQSGNTIVDYRSKAGQPTPDPLLTVQFQNTPFWPAFDQLLDRAGLTVYPYGQSGARQRIFGGKCRGRSPSKERQLQRPVSVRSDFGF